MYHKERQSRTEWEQSREAYNYRPTVPYRRRLDRATKLQSFQHIQRAYTRLVKEVYGETKELGLADVRHFMRL